MAQVDRLYFGFSTSLSLAALTRLAGDKIILYNIIIFYIVILIHLKIKNPALSVGL